MQLNARPIGKQLHDSEELGRGDGFDRGALARSVVALERKEDHEDQEDSEARSRHAKDAGSSIRVREETPTGARRRTRSIAATVVATDTMTMRNMAMRVTSQVAAHGFGSDRVTCDQR